MSGTGDRPFETFGASELDADMEMLLDGIIVHPRLVPLGQLVDDVRLVAGGPPPEPTDELAAILAGHDVAGDGDLSPGAARASRLARGDVPPRPLAASGRRSVIRSRIARRVGALGLGAKAGIGLAVAGAGAVGAGAAGVLPDQTIDAVKHAIEVIMPLDLPDEGASGRGQDHGERDSTASQVTDRDGPDLPPARVERTAADDNPIHEAEPTTAPEPAAREAARAQGDDGESPASPPSTGWTDPEDGDGTVPPASSPHVGSGADEQASDDGGDDGGPPRQAQQQGDTAQPPQEPGGSHAHGGGGPPPPATVVIPPPPMDVDPAAEPPSAVPHAAAGPPSGGDQHTGTRQPTGEDSHPSSRQPTGGHSHPSKLAAGRQPSG